MQPEHPHDPKTREARRLLGQRFGMLMGHDVTHLRLDLLDNRQTVEVVARHWGQLHDPHTGVCTCCPRRPRMTIDGDVVGATP